MRSSPAFSQQPLTTYQTTFWEIALPQTFPVRLTLRKIFPSPIPAATVHSSSARFAHSGIGTVRMCPPLPIKSTMAQCSCRFCTSLISNPTNSDRRSPQPKSNASMA